MKTFFSLLCLAALSGICLADEQTRQIQAALSEAGFYYGTADGKMGEETRAALRRFQIRNGLDVSGTATPETLSALKLGSSEKQPAPGPAAEDEQEIAATAATAATAARPGAFLAPESRVANSEVAPISAVPDRAAKSPVQDFFLGTDLADASAGEQSAALQTAQAQLLRLGYFRSDPNGLPTSEMETALLRFQHALHLRLTGRLDADTRQALVHAPPSVPSQPFRAAKNGAAKYRPPGNVFRGVWVH